ncbi:nuclear pore complex protein Nup58 [Achroia grisella]|uniref:nuclear pore complex protein Nup58 n=1 Tax=Achroia grisella TaxID=688607 RepID=UPI0027D2041F|nr:nuclear pore complex protein Nup58 [Achroia grisella]
MSFSFGTTSSAPATSGLTGGFNFGKPATPGFGLGSTTTQPSTGLFGTPATSAPTFGTGTPAFGATATPAFGAASATPAFGATSTAPSFGTSATPAFGASSVAPTFGSTTTPAFGTTTAAPAFGTTFGATSAPTFGSTTTPAFGTTTNLSLGTGLGTGGLNFGAGTNTSTAATGLSFGTTTTAAASTGLGGLGGFGFASTSTPSTGLGLFGATSTATTSTSFLGAKLGTTTATGTQPSISAAPSFGLGGVTPAAGVGTGNTADAKTESPKQTKLPNEISTTVDSFKEFVKKQKSLSSEVMRVSIKPLHTVSREAEATLRLALSLGSEVARGRAQSRRLRSSAAGALAAAEDAAAAAAAGIELESTPPPIYVKELISELEQQLITFRRQMDVADKQMQSSPKLLTEQELTLGIRRMHESLVALAGRLQAVHTQVEGQKEQYLNLRKYILKDPTNVFETPSPNNSLDQILKDAEGSKKRIKTGNMSEVSFGSAVLSDPRAVLGNIQQLAGPTPFSYLGNTLSPFPGADASGPGWQPQQQPISNTSLNVSSFGVAPATETSTFQLQKPPGKRGKQ